VGVQYVFFNVLHTEVEEGRPSPMDGKVERDMLSTVPRLPTQQREITRVPLRGHSVNARGRGFLLGTLSPQVPPVSFPP
jgi:hypothetical protein